MAAPSALSMREKVGGLAALAFLALLAGGALLALLVEAMRAGTAAGLAFDTWVWRAARFTLWQAVLSTLLSVLPAIAVARALFRMEDSRARRLILQLFAVPWALPAIVAALGVLTLYGRAGWLAPMFSALTGESWGGIFGLSGILLAHVFFNMPLAVRLLLEALQSVPGDRFRLAAQLGMGPGATFRLIEWPAMRAALPGAAGLVFMLCVTSFTVVLTLGGGPAASTLEVAIYQALRFDFDPARAVVLTAVQLALTLAIVLVLNRFGAAATGETNLTLSSGPRFLARNRMDSVASLILVGATTLFVLAPLGAIAVSGIRSDLVRLAGEAQVHRATLTSLALAALAALLSTALSFGLVRLRQRLETARHQARQGWLEWWAGHGASLILVVPPVVIGAGWFIGLRHFGDVFAFAPLMVVTVNAAMAMPFAIRLLRPAHDMAAAQHDRLAANLGLKGMTRFRLVDWPVLRAPMLAAFAFSMALSLGDLGVIALFGSDRVQTLPWLLLSRMGSYRTADAAGLALWLSILTLALMMIVSRLSRRMP